MRYWFLSWFFRIYSYTWRFSRIDLNSPNNLLSSGGIVICWHGDLFPLLMRHRNQNIVPLVSLSRDGDLLVRVLSHLGYSCIRGSSSVGGEEALLAAKEAISTGKIVAFAVDGPKGPPFQMKAGALRLARMLHCGILGMAVAAYPCKYFASWDRFLLPMPFAKVRLQYLVFNDTDVQKGSFMEQRNEIQQKLRNLSHDLGRLLDDSVLP